MKRAIAVECLPVPPPAPKLGLVTIEGHRAHRLRTGKFLRTLIDGEDVTDQCVRANDKRGYVLLNKRDESGRFYIGLDGNIARELRRGNVEYVEIDRRD